MTKHYEDPSYSTRDKEKLCRAGCEVITPKPNQILLDLDSRFNLERISTRAHFISNRYKIIKFELYESRTENHFHGIVTFDKDLAQVEALLLQIYFLSDPYRERHSVTRYMVNGDQDSCLFAPINRKVQEIELLVKDEKG